MYSYSTKIQNCPLAIRGNKREVSKVVKTILHSSNNSEKFYGDYKNNIPKSIERNNLNAFIVNEFNGDINKFCKFIISKLELLDDIEQLLDSDNIECNNIDRAYYEQRPYECRV